MVKLGYKRTKIDNCLYKRIHNNVKGYLLIYVDDLILTANTDEEGKKTPMEKDLKLNDQTEEETQKKTPMEKDLKLNDQTEEETQNDYRQLIGCLMYLRHRWKKI
ncbi:hypothetical protein QE152_g36532 [Popillia japonica]|uniref:Reverse transcriptase Ty1/copia-type domain-containing protein n=1 Tax=Popillia japonica TaxID=7064 RepID=A0AAW1ICX7_POPJA